MNIRPSLIRKVTLVLTAGLLGAACRGSFTEVGATRTDSEVVDAGIATTVSVAVDMNAGELTLAGGSAHLLEADFRYNVDAWDPQVAYDVTGVHGTLGVTQGDSGLPVGEALVNAWDLRLGADMPLELTVNLGAGESDLDLSTLELTGVRVETGAGTVHIDLRGDWDHDVSAIIKGGAGELYVTLPSAMGVRVTTDTALVEVSTAGLTRDGDTYVNPAYGTAPYTLRVDIEAGVGAVDLQVR
jgi:hypothetical protein